MLTTGLLRAAGVILGVASAQAAMAEPSLNDLAARIELRAIETLTITDQQFLTGDKNGKATLIAGELRFPQSASSGRLPAVVLLHGSGGPSGGHELWAKHFNEMGIASFLIDSFSGRGLTGTSTDQALLGRFNMILDAYRGADVLAAHPRIDPARIAVIGFSRGGQSALYSSLTRFQAAWSPRVTFAAHIPLYASCNPTLIGDTEVSAVPIRLFHGAADDYVPVAPCRAYVERLRAAGRDVQLTEFAGAHHSYDNPLGAKCRRLEKLSKRACLQAEGRATRPDRQRRDRAPFSYRPCVETDPHLGYDGAAAQATQWP
jgi:dienelactone hydrolase